MDLSLIGKIGVLLKYVFTSFIPFGLLIIFLLILALLILNFKYKNSTFNIVIIGIFIGTFLGIILSNSLYISYCINSVVKSILNYIYFPSPVGYFFIVLFMVIVTIKTIFDDEVNKVKRIINYVISIICYYLFFLFIVRVTMNGLILMDIANLYSDDVVLSIVQISNLLFVIWVLITLFWKLYIYFKNKFD